MPLVYTRAHVSPPFLNGDDYKAVGKQLYTTTGRALGLGFDLELNVY